MNPAIFGALENGNRVVTATRRLRHEVLKAYDRRQVKLGREVWPTARVSTWDGWIQTLWQEQNIYTDSVLLSTQQLRQVLSQIIEQDLETSRSSNQNIVALWNVSATAKTALSAWQLCHQWQIPYTSLQDAPSDDHARFGRWASKLYARLSQQSWISQAQLPEQIIKHGIRSHENVILVGFDQFDRQQKTFIEFYRKGGAHSIEIHNETPVKTSLKRYSYATRYEEWQHIGAWARNHLEKQSDARLGIITPDIESIQPVATLALREQLIPSYFRDSSPDPFHFSRGDSLLDVAVIHSALICLGLLGTMEYPQLEEIFLSDYWGNREEQQLRAELAIKLRRKIAFQFDLFRLSQVLSLHCERNHLELHAADELLDRLALLQSIKQKNRQPQPVTRWRGLFTHCLSILGWPGERMDSADYQALQAWEKCLEDWVRLDMVSRPLPLEQAILSLQNHCRETVFQAQTRNAAPVQVMGVLEAAGLDLDAVWLAGFDESAWPPPVSINPFVPVALQIERGVPEASPSLQHELVSGRTAELCRLCPAVSFSHARIQDDIELGVSRIMPDIPRSAQTELPAVFALEETLRTSTPPLETRLDDHGLPYQNTHTKGGTGLIQKQSSCPFSAYAQYRLNVAEDERPQIGMDNMQRGSLLHQTMEGIWNELGNSQALLDQDKLGTLNRLINRHAREQVKYFARHSGLGEGYQQAETGRLTSLIREWLDIEKERLPFRVVATEHKIEYRAGELQFTIKIDRIDEISLPGSDEPGSRLIMDYKSGRCSLRDWAYDRPAQPQVPLYCLAMEEDNSLRTDAVAFAQVCQGEAAFVGIGRVDDILPGVGSLASLKGNTALKKEYPNWEELEPGWRAHINNLVTEFKQGIATVDPRHDACTWCKFGPLCRIHTRNHGVSERGLD